MNMRIQDAILQTRPFRSIREEALVNLLYTYGWLTGKSRKILKPFGITPTQYNILRILKGAGKPISTSDIRDRMLDKNSDASRAVDRLLKKGWVIKRQCPSDRRLIDVELSASGIELMNDLKETGVEFSALLSKLSKNEARQLSELLDKIRS